MMFYHLKLSAGMQYVESLYDGCSGFPFAMATDGCLLFMLYRYQEYKSEYITTQKRTYFEAHKDEEW